MKRASSLLLICTASALMTATACHGNQNVLDAQSTSAGHIEWLWWLIFIISAVAFALTVMALCIGSARSYTSHTVPPEPFEDKLGDERAKPVVATAVAITVISLFAILFASVITGKKVEGLTSKNPVSIQVIGHQWWWEFRYLNSDASMTVTTANELHIPVGVPISVQLSSADVIHSFWVPNLFGKRDLIPGYQRAFFFEADKQGVYRGQCAEFCGHQHAHMSFYVVAEPVANFHQWLLEQVKSAPEPNNSSTARGREVFLTGPCVMCHTVRGTPAGSRVGPDLTHVASRRTIAAGTLANQRGNLAGWILDSQHIKPGNRMPPNNLSGDDLNALLDYLETLN
ncbi:MAG TPA: cytochrome c oxidase subunit II [Terriglobales bacterium]